MSGIKLRQIGKIIAPSIPEAWQADFMEFQRLLARRMAVVAASATLVILPTFQLIEFFLYGDDHDIGLRNALWRLPVMLTAFVVLAMRWWEPRGEWPRPLLLLLSFAMMSMMVGIFTNDKIYDGAPIQYTSQGLIIAIAAVALTATRGLRDVPIIYGIPFLSLPLLLHFNGVNMGQAAINLIYPLTMVVVACVIAELLYHGNVQTFLSTQKLRQSAMTDPLTHLLNRRAMDSELEAAHSRWERHGHRYAVIMADLDRFKKVNDTHGHDVGDQVLEELGKRLTESVRAEDRVSRWGGEEFLLLLHEVSEDEAMQVAEKIRAGVEANGFSTTAGSLPITISLGVALNQADSSAEQVTIRADEALYAAKQGGRNRVVLAK